MTLQATASLRRRKPRASFSFPAREAASGAVIPLASCASASAPRRSKARNKTQPCRAPTGGSTPPSGWAARRPRAGERERRWAARPGQKRLQQSSVSGVRPVASTAWISAPASTSNSMTAKSQPNRTARHRGGSYHSPWKWSRAASCPAASAALTSCTEPSNIARRNMGIASRTGVRCGLAPRKRRRFGGVAGGTSPSSAPAAVAKPAEPAVTPAGTE
mmetsp:Transcript_67114/g.170238  ORF Transcript_67114/g.170238 Transcript_67114/m.170238 type:complete len:218 (-) Transcript_67114:88-741(-)